MKTKDTLITGFVIIFIALLTYVWFSPSGLKRAPNIELITTTGEKLNLSSLRGRPILITFWATSCPSCVKEMPFLTKLHNAYAPQGLKIIGISMPSDRPDFVMKMVQQKALPYTIAMDVSKEAVKGFGGVTLTPTTFLISPSGIIVWHKIGEFDIKALTLRVTKLLAESQGYKQQSLQPTNAVKKLN